MAREHNIAVLAIADLRKAATYKPTKPDTKGRDVVTLDDVRGSARLVYDAVNVFYISATQANNPGSEPTGVITLRALKTRYSGMGARGDAVSLRWYPASGHVCDLEMSDATEPVVGLAASYGTGLDGADDHGNE